MGILLVVWMYFSGWVELLQRVQVGVEGIGAVVPEALVALDPAGCLRQGAPGNPGRTELRIAPAGDQPCPFEHAKVLRDGGESHVERGGQLPHRRLALAEPRQDRPTGRVGEGGEGGTEQIGGHCGASFVFNLSVQYQKVEY